MSNRTGRLVVVDIGSEETKLMDVSVSNSITIYNIERMRDMSPFIEDGKLVNFEQFVLSLKDTLKAKGIKTKRLLLTSSVLGIETDIVHFANDTAKAIETAFKNSTASVKPELNRVDFQIYNTYTTESESNVYCIQASASNYVVSSLLKLLEASGFTVIDVIDPVSSLLNIIKLYPSSYDIQSRLYVNVGHTTTIYPVVRDTPLDRNDLPVTFYSVVEALQQSFELPELKIRKLLNVVGMKQDPTLQKELIDAGVDMDTYYGIIQECVGDFKKRLTNQLKQYNTIQKYGIFNIVLCGGFVDMPGLLDALQEGTDYTFEIVPDSMQAYTDIVIKNKTHENFSSTYDVCLGAALSKFYKRHISLKPKYSSSRMPVEVTEKVCGILTVVACAAIAFGGFTFYQNYVELDRLEGVKQETMKMQGQYTQAERKLTEQQAYLDALKNVDSLMQPLTNYVRSKETPTFTIASIDSRNLLVGAQLNETGAMDFLDETAPATDASADGSAGSAFIDDSTPTAAPGTKSPIVIRGYALSTDEISNFYDGLRKLDFVRDVNMNGQRLVQLPSTETMYIFEIQIER